MVEKYLLAVVYSNLHCKFYMKIGIAYKTCKTFFFVCDTDTPVSIVFMLSNNYIH